MGKFVFGPVPSRRLGFSLGVDIIPRKVCTFDCIYCQVGKTTKKEITRKSFLPPGYIIEEVIQKVEETPYLDYISFSGSGEPTLNSDIGFIIRAIKKETDKPVAVITNGSLLHIEEVRKDIMPADVVLPSLDAASEEVFRYINKPHDSLSLNLLIEGLRQFRDVYPGKIWLEVMLIKNVNDNPDELKKLGSLITSLKVDKVHLNTVTRPPSEKIDDVFTATELVGIQELLGIESEIIGDFKKKVDEPFHTDWTETILQVLQRRSLTLDDVVRATGIATTEAEQRLEQLEKEGQISHYRFDNRIYFVKND